MTTARPETSKKAPHKRRSRNEIPEKVDVAIVGCGLGGLVSGAYLAQQGLKVALFDSHYVAGGCATVFARGSGANRYHFDVGLHYIGDCGEPGGMIPKVLRGLGIEQEFVPMNQSGFDRLRFPDLSFDIPASIPEYRERLVQMFPSEKRGIDRYVRLLNQMDRVGRKMDKNAGKMSPAILFKILTSGYYLARYQNATIEQFLDSCTLHPGLRAVILGQNGDYGLPPSEVSALLHAGLGLHYFRGAYYPKGGGQIISDKLADKIEACGGTIHLRRGIDSILVKDGKAVGVRTEPRRGEVREVMADTVISNADIKKTILELVPQEAVPAKWQKRASEWQMGGAIFMTFLGVKKDMSALGASNYWCFDTLDMEAFYQDARRAESPTSGCAYITSATQKDPESRAHHAPEGVDTIEIMTIVPGDAQYWGVEQDAVGGWKYKRDGGYTELKKRLEDDMVARLEKLFPGTEEHIVYRESATPVTHSRYTRASQGTGYGLACTPGQFMDNRPGYRSPIDGLYFAGASTRAGHGIVGAMSSGYHAALGIARAHGRPILAR